MDVLSISTYVLIIVQVSLIGSRSYLFDILDRIDNRSNVSELDLKMLILYQIMIVTSGLGSFLINLIQGYTLYKLGVPDESSLSLHVLKLVIIITVYLLHYLVNRLVGVPIKRKSELKK